jgi:hypothetical protein
MSKFCCAFFLAVTLVFQVPNLFSYSVLTHEAVIDAQWKESIEPLLRRRFHGLSAEGLKQAHAYAYGGSIIQDMGYYPFGSHFFTDLTHYVRSGDFVAALLRNAQNANDYAFALGALAHYTSDNIGHPVATNRAVPILFPKLRRRFGNNVTYADDPGAHLKTEFGFDVLQVAKGRYAPDAYRDFVGFEVSKPALEAAFRETYGLELTDVFSTLDLAIGTYRKTVSDIIPKMTQVAWDMKKDEIQKDVQGITREKFLYNLSKAEYEKTWGHNYQEPGAGSRVLAWVIRIFPKVGPFAAVKFRTPTPETEKMFMDSFNKTVERYKALLAAEGAHAANPPDSNLDVGKPTTAGMYQISDEAYAKLVHKLAEHDFERTPRSLRDQIVMFYENGSPPASPKLRKELQALKGKRKF